MRQIRVAAFGLALALGAATGWAADPTIVAGRLTYISEKAIEVDGRRILLTPESGAISQGRPVSVKSLRPGALAEAEIDEVGRLIELRVNRVVE